MKVVILAGGFGTRISEETENRPKPMIEIGGRPILWHIMKIYSHYGFNDFIICLGYKGYLIKEYFHHYSLYLSDLVIDLKDNRVEYLNPRTESWRITMLDTGLTTMTGGRIKRIQPFVQNETFMLTYGDGVGDVNISALLAFHRAQNKLATVTATQPTGKFGSLDLDESDRVVSFMEKPKGDGTWVNAGFFVLEPKIFEYITEGDETYWERSPMEQLVMDRQLAAFKHRGFWKPMDTLRDKRELESLWQSGQAAWKVWD